MVELFEKILRTPTILSLAFICKIPHSRWSPKSYFFICTVEVN